MVIGPTLFILLVLYVLAAGVVAGGLSVLDSMINPFGRTASWSLILIASAIWPVTIIIVLWSLWDDQ